MVTDQPAVNLCACGCGAPIDPRSTYRRGHAPRAPQPPQRVTLQCPVCGTSFEVAPYQAETKTYCSPQCRWRVRRTWKADTQLKGRVLGKMQAGGLTGPQAATATGIPYTSLRAWFSVPDRLLNPEHLAKAAAWLGIRAEDAERLQGGSLADKKRAIAEMNRSTARAAAHRERLSSDPAYRRQIGTSIAEANRGSRRTEESRARISAGLKAYRERPDAHPLGQHKKTLRGRVLQVRAMIARGQPQLSEDEITALTIQRIARPPFSIANEERARTLAAPKQLKKPVRRRAARRPHRCAILQELDAKYRRAAGKRAYGFMVEYRQRVQAIEGDDTPTDADLWKDIYRHCLACPRHRAGAPIMGR